MTYKKGKEKNAIIPKERKEMIARRPYDLWMDMDRLFDRFRSNFDELIWGSGINMVTSSDFRTPALDVVDLGDKFEMHIEMPGIKKDDIKVEVTPTSVEICAGHEETSKDKGGNWLRQERSSTDFYRHLTLPENIRTGDVDAELKDGVLTLLLQKVEPKPKLKTKQIKIK
jgi:HSP20 family protein